MATLTDYKGLNVVENATGDGGVALTDNFKELADRTPYQAAANPGVNDDSTLGFSPGDQWLNTSTQVLWSCVSNSTGAAVWKSVFKRTATALELIPEEPGDFTEIGGNLKVNGEAGIGGESTVGYPLTLHQNADQTGLRVHGYDDRANAYGTFSISGGGLLHIQSSEGVVYLNQGGSVTAIAGQELRLIPGARLAFTTNSSSVTSFSMGGQNVSGGDLILSVGNSLASPIVRFKPDGNVHLHGNTLRLESSRTPASATAAGNQGDVCWDDDYVYVCVATDTWKRSALTTW